jgi:hypothetical protein
LPSRGCELNGNALAIAQFKTPSSPLSDTRPTIELMRSININELRRVIPRYSNTINEPNVSLKYPDLLVCVFPPCLEITHYFRARTMLRIVWDTTYFGRHRANWYAVAAIAVLFAYSPAMAVMPAAIATTRRKKTIKSAVNASPPLAASRLQARYRRLRDAIGTGEIGLHFAHGKPLQGFCALVRCESSGPAKSHPTVLGALSAFACTGTD